MCTTFLAALDQVCLLGFKQPLAPNICVQTIVATALPTIVSELGGGKDYSWVGTYVYSLGRPAFVKPAKASETVY